MEFYVLKYLYLTSSYTQINSTTGTGLFTCRAVENDSLVITSITIKCWLGGFGI